MMCRFTLAFVIALTGCEVIVAERPENADSSAPSDAALDVRMPAVDGGDVGDGGDGGGGNPDLAVEPALAGWAMPYHDTRNTSRSSARGPAQGRVAWTAAVRSVGSPVIAPDGTLYVGSGTNLGILALSPKDGTVSWMAGMGCQNLALGPDGTIYTDPCTNVPRLCAVDPATKMSRWCVITPSDPTLPMLVGRDGTIFVIFPTHTFAFAAADGRTLWSRKNETLGVGLALGPDEHVLYVGLRDRITVCDAGTGARKRDMPVIGSLMTPPSVGEDGSVYFVESSDSNRLVSAAGEGGGNNWVYSLAFADAVGPAAVAPDGTVRITVSSGGADGTLLAIDGQGKRLWSTVAPAAAPGPAILDARGVTYFVGGPGRVYAVDPAGATTFDVDVRAMPGAPLAIGPAGLLHVPGGDGKLLAIGP